MKDNHFLAIAVMILIMSAIVYYLGEGISGYSVTNYPIASVYPQDAEAGTTITISIDPGENGINKYATFLKGVSDMSSITLCKTNRCLEPVDVEFFIPENWGEGSYSLRFFDYETSSYNEVNFNVRR